MTQQPHPPKHAPDCDEVARRYATLCEQGQRVAQAVLERQANGGSFSPIDPASVTSAFLQATARLLADPVRLAEAQARFWQEQTELLLVTGRRMAGEETPPLVEPAPGDRRFKDSAWSEGAMFDFVKQSYLLGARWLQSLFGEVEGLDAKTRQKVAFFTRQYVDAMAPSNFVLTNPVVLRKAAESGGEVLLKGMENLLGDLERGRGRLQIRMTDQAAFRLGENVAVSPGKVIYQNELMQLIQYAPTTETVHRRPLLIVPPWINKFYILDLQPRNSFIKWAVDQGFTLFVISWAQPSRALAGKGFEDYMLEGPLEALGAIERATGEREANVLGFCIGGVLTAATLAYMAAQGDDRLKAATFLATIIDFEEPGELGVFIDEGQLAHLERHMSEKGYLEGHHMADLFNLMRANDLIWSFVVNNYLLGKDPITFDLLYWNSDATRLPARMLSYYLRNMYQENRLAQPGGISLAGVPIDLSRIALPTYFLATREDHITPWKSTYRGTQIFAGPARFVLGASGHIAGVINPPAAGKYGYWTRARLPRDPEAWLAKAAWHEGSWWPDWSAWLARHSGSRVPARQPGDGRLEPLEEAPGSYVKVRALD